MNISAIGSNFTHGITPKTVQKHPIAFRANTYASDNFFHSKLIMPYSPEWKKIKNEGKKLYSKSLDYLRQARDAKEDCKSILNQISAIYTEDLGITEEYYSKLFNEALKLFEDAKNNNFETIKREGGFQRGDYWDRREVEIENDTVTITEYDDEDTDEVTKKIVYTPSTITYEKVRYASGLVDEFVMDNANGRLISLRAGLNRFVFSDGYSTEKEFYFDKNGALTRYEEKHKTDKHGKTTIKGLCLFANGKPKNIYLDYEENSETKMHKASEMFSCKNGVLRTHNVKYKGDDSGNQYADKQSVYDASGEISAVAFDYAGDPRYSVYASKVYNYENNAIAHIQVGHNSSRYTGVSTAEKIYYINPYAELETCTTDNKGNYCENYQISDIRSQKSSYIK